MLHIINIVNTGDYNLIQPALALIVLNSRMGIYSLQLVGLELLLISAFSLESYRGDLLVIPCIVYLLVRLNEYWFELILVAG